MLIVNETVSFSSSTHFFVFLEKKIKACPLNGLELFWRTYK